MSRLLLTDPPMPRFNAWNLDTDEQTHQGAYLSDIIPIEYERFDALHASIVERGRDYYFKDSVRLLITKAS